MQIPPDHPRYWSLRIREMLVKGLEEGMVGKTGLIAHGRGEAFDYLFAEKSQDFALEAIRASAATLLLARHPVISVNGNVAALVRPEVITLSKLIPADMEINLFYWSKEREDRIKDAFERECPDCTILTQENDCSLPGLRTERSRISRKGINKADVVLVPLEDGDRVGALNSAGKMTIAVDLNPFSRTARTADITIVDNIVRAFPRLIEEIVAIKGLDNDELADMARFDNKECLEKAVGFLRSRADDL